MSNYKAGDYTRRYLQEVEEVCSLRKVMNLPCPDCKYFKIPSCPEVYKNLPPNIKLQNKAAAPI